MKKEALQKKFGSNIRELRHTKGISQEMLAELSGLHRTYVGGIERGERNVALMNIVRIAKALDVEPGILFQGMGDNL